MPCVFPVLGIKVLGFVQQAGGDKKKIKYHGLTFAAGITISLWVLVSILFYIKSKGQSAGWGFQFTELMVCVGANSCDVCFCSKFIWTL